MSSTNKTTHYELSQYVGSDKPTYLSDYNGDMLKIDTAINSAKAVADTATADIATLSTSVTTAQNTANTAVTNAATAQTTANTAISNIGTLANLETAAKTNVVNAINEVVENVGNKANLTTTNKTDLVSAINEIKGVTDDYEEVVLYTSNGTTGTITLSDLITNYDRVFIYYYQAGWVESLEIDGTKVGYEYESGVPYNRITITGTHLYAIENGVPQVQELAASYRATTIIDQGVSKTQLTREFGASRVNSTSWGRDDSALKIYKIIGFKL